MEWRRVERCEEGAVGVPNVLEESCVFLFQYLVLLPFAFKLASVLIGKDENTAGGQACQTQEDIFHNGNTCS